MLWTKNLETGVPQIDEQHRELFAQADKLLDRTQKDRIPATLEFLKNYVNKHFTAEEGLQRASQYPKAAFHHGLHVDFSRKFQKLYDEYKSGQNPKVVFSINNMVISWLKDHIMTHDKEFANFYLQKTQAKSKPATGFALQNLSKPGLLGSPSKSSTLGSKASNFGPLRSNAVHESPIKGGSIFGNKSGALGKTSESGIFKTSVTRPSPIRITSPAPNKLGTTASPTTNRLGTTTSPATNRFGTTTSPTTNRLGTTTSPATNRLGTTTSPTTNRFGTTTSPATNRLGTTTSPTTNRFSATTPNKPSGLETTAKSSLQSGIFKNSAASTQPSRFRTGTLGVTSKPASSSIFKTSQASTGSRFSSSTAQAPQPAARGQGASTAVPSLWNKNLETGVPKIDEQHMELFVQVAKLKDSSQKDRIPATLEFLKNYVVKHFSMEEALMKVSHYPKYDLHHGLHVDFTQKFSKLYDEFKTSGEKLSVVLAINNVATSWLKEHIMVHDKEFANYYIQRNAEAGNIIK